MSEYRTQSKPRPKCISPGAMAPARICASTWAPRRGLARPGSVDWILNLFYWASSNYGQSVVWPLIWLVVLLAMGGSVFYAMHTTTPSTTALSLEAIPHAAALSFANLIPFVPITHEIINANAVAGLSRTEKIIGVLQTLLGTPLLFLLGLALRNRFRMR
jgi:hypothetical protein